jgi:hypothetical protein
MLANRPAPTIGTRCILSAPKGCEAAGQTSGVEPLNDRFGSPVHGNGSKPDHSPLNADVGQRASASTSSRFAPNDLGEALENLGERESGTARLQEAVAAYRAALEERVRELVPLQWATSTGNQGVAMMVIANRTNDAALAEVAVRRLRRLTRRRNRTVKSGGRRIIKRNCRGSGDPRPAPRGRAANATMVNGEAERPAKQSAVRRARRPVVRVLRNCATARDAPGCVLRCGPSAPQRKPPKGASSVRHYLSWEPSAEMEGAHLAHSRGQVCTRQRKTFDPPKREMGRAQPRNAAPREEDRGRARRAVTGATTTITLNGQSKVTIGIGIVTYVWRRDEKVGKPLARLLVPRARKDQGKRNFHPFVEMSWLTLGVKTLSSRKIFGESAATACRRG